MAILNKGQTFSDGEQVTSAKLNTAVDGATFASGAVDDVSTQLSGGAIIVKDGGVTLQKLATAVKDALYPVGSIYTNATNSTNPATLIGFGTWVAFGAGKVPVGIDASDTDFDTAEETGGSKTHTLTTSEMPSHSHAYTKAIHPSGSGAEQNQSGGAEDRTNFNGTDNTGLTGGGQSHNNLQPYVVVYMWKRTA
jgi:hypothetical protein